MLKDYEIDEIRNIALHQRQALGFGHETVIANDIISILDRLQICLLEYPVPSKTLTPSFSAALIYYTEGGNEFVCIGVNTADFYDKQIFAIAHELYHYYTKTGSHLSRLERKQTSETEIKANRFAAEFLFPEQKLKSIILSEFRTQSLQSLSIPTLLRLIARLHCTWWLPYRSLVKRLRTIHAISEKQLSKLYSIDERNMSNEYGRLGRAIDQETFRKLNTATSAIGTSPNNLEIIIRNYEDGLIDDKRFLRSLQLFGKHPKDFGYEIPETLISFDEFLDKAGFDED